MLRDLDCECQQMVPTGSLGKRYVASERSAGQITEQPKQSGLNCKDADSVKNQVIDMETPATTRGLLLFVPGGFQRPMLSSADKGQRASAHAHLSECRALVSVTAQQSWMQVLSRL